MQRTTHCRIHGGVFRYIARKGRRPVDCAKGLAPCTNAPGSNPDEALPVGSEVTVGGVKFTKHTAVADAQHVQDVKDAIATRVIATKQAQASIPDSRGMGRARAAKARLEALGWTATGKAEGSAIIVTAARGDETIVMEWRDGAFAGQTYFAWDSDAPQKNAKPHGTDLGFDPDEIPDRELIRYLHGMRVTWWNRLAANTEQAIVGDKITIQHNYVGDTDARPGDRIITFIDKQSGFRSFRLDALIKIG